MPTQKQTHEPQAVTYKMRKSPIILQDRRFAGNTAGDKSQQLFGDHATESAESRDQMFEQKTVTKGSDQTFGSSWNPGQGQGPDPYDLEHPIVKKNPGDNDQVSTKEQKPELTGKEKDTYPWVSRLINKIRGPQTKGSASSVPLVPYA
jgi:hypothetical protein